MEKGIPIICIFIIAFTNVVVLNCLPYLCKKIIVYPDKCKIRKIVTINSFTLSLKGAN